MNLEIREWNESDVVLICQAINRRRESDAMSFCLTEADVGSWLRFLVSKSSLLFLLFDQNSTLEASVRIDEDEFFFYAALACYCRFDECKRESIMHFFENWFRTTPRGSVKKDIRWIAW